MSELDLSNKNESDRSPVRLLCDRPASQSVESLERLYIFCCSAEADGARAHNVESTNSVRYIEWDDDEPEPQPVIPAADDRLSSFYGGRIQSKPQLIVASGSAHTRLDLRT